MAVSDTAGAQARGDRKPGARGRRNLAVCVDDQPVPVVIDFVGALHGLTVQDQELASHEVGGVTPVGITISRSPTTIAVAGFIMALLLAMSLAVLVVTLSVALWGRKVE